MSVTTFITEVLDELSEAPQRSNRDTYASLADPFLAGMENVPTQNNIWATQANAMAVEINDTVDEVLIAAAIVTSLANSKGEWSLLTGSLTTEYSVYHNYNNEGGRNWQLLKDLVDVTTVEPGTDSTTWVVFGNYNTTQDLGTISTSTTVSTSNGNIAKATIAGDLTFTFSSDAPTGDADIILLRMTNPGAYTLTWTDVLWAGDAEPAWQEDGVDIAYFIRDDIGGLWRGLKLWSGLVTTSA